MLVTGLLAESDEELLSLAASFNEEMETRRQAEGAFTANLAKMQTSKQQYDASLFSINEQMSSLKSSIQASLFLLNRGTCRC